MKNMIFYFRTSLPLKGITWGLFGVLETYWSMTLFSKRQVCML